MSTFLAPVKTADGHAELAQRLRKLGQRYRTVLLLVDGRRSVSQVLTMAAAAGVPRECFDELVAMGLIDLGSPQTTDHVELPLETAEESSVLPSVASLLPESEQGEPILGSEFDEPLSQLDDGPLEEAREMLMRAVRNEAPVTGSLLLMKLRRARSRDDIEGLLDEVEQRIRKPRRQIIATQVMRQVRHLLTLPASTEP